MIAAIIPDPLEKTEIDFLRTSLGHIKAHLSKTCNNSLENPPKAETAGKIHEYYRIRPWQPDIKRTVIGTIDNPFIWFNKLSNFGPPLISGSLDPSRIPEFFVQMNYR